MAEVFTLVESVLELASSTKNFLSAEPRAPKLNRSVTRALRALYFTPNGVLSLLKQIEDGQEPDSDRTREVLVEFNDKEWRVRESLEALDFDHLRHQLGLTLDRLEMVRLGKLSLRREIQEEINYYWRPRAAPNKEKK
ncbi:MAG: hypothetical protein ACR2J1_03440 [Methyloceanibacter sp.]|uniref:hypothetical protein n=1 Tax=Methyloceanibacter sp. TaxID=1965321 RepID=UPI003D9B3013